MKIKQVTLQEHDVTTSILHHWYVTTINLRTAELHLSRCWSSRSACPFR